MVKKHRVLVVNLEFLLNPPNQNFDNEKNKINNKNIWYG